MIFTLIPASLLRFGRQRLQQKVGQSLDQPLRVLAHWGMKNLTFQLEDELRAIAISASPHCPSPSSLEDGIVRLASDSRRATRERQRVR
ncbi:hypothetical protein [Mesorhizobium sp. L-8-10]|uniref:hypothetical protein n=1 Tax=Mesorhizobium sp. L-8-10 TaxID=2744523 RepID=UPI0019273A56|nr:hypothetical protein [Mesorhizobium sp. L-8-10]